MKYIFLMLPLIYICGNIYVFRHSLQAIAALPLWAKITWSVIFWISAFSLFISIGLRNSAIPEIISNIMFNIGSIWMAFLLYMVLTLAVLDMSSLAINPIKGKFWYATAIVTVILVLGNITYHRPKIEHIHIDTQKQFKKQRMRIVAVSDIHLGYGTGTKALSRYVDLINAQSPDLILIAGDMIDNSIEPLLKNPFDKELKRLSAPVYIAPGNHEYISGIDACMEYLSSVGITVLKDSVITLPEGIQLIGRDDRTNRKRLSLEALLESTDESMPTIVIDHQPYDLSHTDSLCVDIQISGHTHDGQIWPLNLIIDMIYEQGHGYRKWTNTHIWVSSGLSLWGPPFRIGTHSDMAVIELSYNE